VEKISRSIILQRNFITYNGKKIYLQALDS